MKKFYRLLLVGLLLAPFATLPLDVHAQEAIASEITQPDEAIVPIDTTSPIRFVRRTTKCSSCLKRF